MQRNNITESNRALSLEEASLKDPARIDRLAKQIGMQRPAGGQLQSMDTAIADPSTPVMAQANGITVISAQP